eukprot:6182401-Pleurochrysis_carterae.AAC.3
MGRQLLHADVRLTCSPRARPTPVTTSWVPAEDRCADSTWICPSQQLRWRGSLSKFQSRSLQTWERPASRRMSPSRLNFDPRRAQECGGRLPCNRRQRCCVEHEAGVSYGGERGDWGVGAAAEPSRRCAACALL